MDATHVPYMDEFDVVGAFHALEHIKDAAQYLSNRKPNPHYNLHNKLAISGLANWSMERALGVERVSSRPECRSLSAGRFWLLRTSPRKPRRGVNSACTI